MLTGFCGLRSKLYSIGIQEQNDFKKAKRVKASVVKSTINFKDYTTCLSNNLSLSRKHLNI